MAGVKEMQRLAEANKKKELRIYNPDTEDFTYSWHGKPYTIPALDVGKFPFHIANHLKKHLANHILWKRGIGKATPELLLKRIFEEIEEYDRV